MKSFIMQKNTKKLLKILILLIIITILNSVVVKATDDTVISRDNWKEWQERDYWEWHTRTTTDDQAYNGEHIVLQNDIIDFYGYWQNSYKDFLYKEYENAGKKIFKFQLDESKASYHTLEGAGFIFNASKKNDKLSGYVILFKEKTICLYRLDDVDINTFETTPKTTLDTYGKLIDSKDKSDSEVRNLVIEATPTNITVTEDGKEILNIDLDYSIHIGESFGLISSYVQHSCSILSKIQFCQIDIILEDYKVSVLNTDINNTPIQGGYFELKNEKGKIIKEGKTNSNGIFSIDGIKEGTYAVQQTKEPEGYILNDTVYKFKVTSEGKIVDIDTGKEISLIVKNEKIKVENNNNDNNTNAKTDDDKQEDNTKSSIPIPNAGEKAWMFIIVICLSLIFSVCVLLKLREYKVVK